MDDQTAVTYYGAPQIITVRYLLAEVPGDDYPGKTQFLTLMCAKSVPVFSP